MRRHCRNGERVQKTDTFSASFIEKLTPAAACRAQGAAVIHPRHRGRAEEDHLKLKGPHRSFQRQPCALIRCEAIAVELHMPRLILQQQVAHMSDDRICHVPAKQAIVARPDKLRDHEHLDLESCAERASQQAEKRVSPMSRYEPSIKAADEPGEKPCMFLLFLDEQIERRAIIRIFGIGAPRLGEQAASLAAFAELKMRERSRDPVRQCKRGGNWQFPVGFGAFETVLFEVGEPMGGVHDRMGWA